MNAALPQSVLHQASQFAASWTAVGVAWASRSHLCNKCDYLDHFEGAPGEPLVTCGLNAGIGKPSDCLVLKAKQE